MNSSNSNGAAEMQAIATLVPTRFGTYAFEFDGMAIHHPATSECGRFWVGPQYYGFAVLDLGSGQQAWAREFQLEDGTPVTMLVTQDGQAELNRGRPLEIAVYRDEGRYLSWSQDEGPSEDAPPTSIRDEAWSRA